jgi:diguanylate cyclase (GGDEF)-like protein
LIFYLLDVDRFKEINEEFGQQSGDMALTQLAERLLRVVRRSDLLVRWGGEQFLILSRSTERKDGAVLAQRILDTVAAEPLEVSGDHSLRRTCSMGWVPFPWLRSAPDKLSVEQVLDLAEKALLVAKNSGRNQAVGLAPVAELEDDEVQSVERHTFSGQEVYALRNAGPALTAEESERTEAASTGSS